VTAPTPAPQQPAGTSPSEPDGFVVRQPGYQGDLAGLARALRSGALAPRELDLRSLVDDVLIWFEREAERDLDLASTALPQVAQVLELKLRLLLPRPPRDSEDDEDLPETSDETLAAVALLEDLESAIDFLRRRRFERSVVLPARTPRPDLPRPRRPVATTASRLAALASNLRPGGYFELAHDRLTLEDALRRLRSALARLARGTLRTLTPSRSWAERTVLFSAFLELVREGRVSARQDEPYGEIEVERR
jgi:segregation and condensation protein A